MSGRCSKLVFEGVCLLFLGVSAMLAAGQSTQRVVRTLPTRLNPPTAPASQPGSPPAPLEHFVPVLHPPETQIADSILAWDAPTKDYMAKLGEVEARFTFNVTNVSSGEVVIHSVNTSCGCTVAQLPSVPWVLAPGSNGQIHATMNLAGKIGNVTKSLTINSDKGQRTLLVRASIPTGAPKPAPGPIPLVGERELNQRLAKSDRQAVFKGDCAKCHAEPAAGKTGGALYAGVCGICHDSPQRASMVPDLHNLKHETNAQYWKDWVVHGKDGTMMPAFSHVEGGPLIESQIDSLVDYLTKTFPQKTAADALSPKPAGD
jgi:mono/diheme cytochrome c family protein